jgi:hypothetical protein
MTHPWSPPRIKPFERLQVTDGLLMNAERWRLDHEYHRRRQNAHYQSLNQPGIVSELGVCPIAPPSEVRAQYRDGRWLQIQPGIAIDCFGNFIVVTEPINFRLASKNCANAPLMVYLVVSYVDPEKLRHQSPSDRLRETFRIDEKTSPADPDEVELCRILLPALGEGETEALVQLATPPDVFFPSYNHIDLRHRPQARSRPQAVVRVTQLLHSVAADDTANLSFLLQSLTALYPAMAGEHPVSQVAIEDAEQCLECDLLYLKVRSSVSLTPAQMQSLSRYLEGGGILLVEASVRGTPVESLLGVDRQLQDAIARLDANMSETEYSSAKLADFAAVRQELATELQETQASLDSTIQDICQDFHALARQFGTPLEDVTHLSPPHPLRTHPFLFAALPVVGEEPIQLLVGGGIILIVGDLSAGWGIDELRSLPRETIRTAQEMGINLLHYAWRRRQMLQLQQASTSTLPPPEKPPERRKKSKLPQSIFDKLM